MRPSIIVGLTCALSGLGGESLADTGGLSHAGTLTDSASLHPASLERIVALRDGSIYRGEIVELVPQQYIILKLRSGAERTFRWREIQRQDIPGAAALPVARSAKDEPLQPKAPESPQPTLASSSPLRQPTPVRAPEERSPTPKKPPQRLTETERPAEEQAPPESFASRPQLPPRAPMTRLPPELAPYKADFEKVTIRSPIKDIALEYLSDSFEGANFGMILPVTLEGWRVACRFPCAELVYKKSTFRVTGPDITDSSKFTLHTKHPEIFLNVKPSNAAVRGVGITFAILGPLVLLGGLGALAAYNVETTHGPPANRGPLLLAGIVATVGGAGLLAGGIAMAVLGKTRVTISRPPKPDEGDDE